LILGASLVEILISDTAILQHRTATQRYTHAHLLAEEFLESLTATHCNTAIQHPALSLAERETENGKARGRARERERERTRRKQM